MNAFEAAEKNGKAAELQQELETLFKQSKQKHYVRYYVYSGYFFAGNGYTLKKSLSRER